MIDALTLAVAVTQLTNRLEAAEADADRLAEALEELVGYVQVGWDIAQGPLAAHNARKLA